MSQGANVEDLDIFRYMKTGLIKFRQVVETSLINADSQAARTLAWLEGEQTAYWQSQIRKRQEAVLRLREAIRQKKLFKDAAGRTPSAFHEEKQLQAALRAVEEAEMKLAATRKHIPQLQKQIEVYRGGVQGLGSMMVSEVPKAVAMLERLSMTLQDYVSLASKVAAPGELPAAAPGAEGNMQRGGESADQARPSKPQSAPSPPAQQGGKPDVAG